MAFDRIERWPRHHGKDLLNQLVMMSEQQIRIYAPVGETGGILRHTGHKRAQLKVGGAGGGSYYQAEAGVEPIRGSRDTWGRKRGPQLYPRDVELGTTRWIESTRARGRLTFKKQGEPRKYRLRVSGQRPQRFVFAAFHQTSIYARTRVMSLGREIVR